MAANPSPNGAGRPDAHTWTDAYALRHFSSEGLYEGLQGSESFHTKTWLDIYPELKGHYGAKGYLNALIDYAGIEGRPTNGQVAAAYPFIRPIEPPTNNLLSKPCNANGQEPGREYPAPGEPIPTPWATQPTPQGTHVPMVLVCLPSPILPGFIWQKKTL